MTAPIVSMDKANAEQWSVMLADVAVVQQQMPVRIKALLHQLAALEGGFAVNQLVHCLQTATRAERAGASEELIMAALCHDVGKVISLLNHPAIAAEILRPYVSDETYWIILNHQEFQGRHYYRYIGKDPEARRQFENHPAFELAQRFADEWDQNSFDPDYDTFSLEHFEPMIDRVFGKKLRLGSPD
jgi:predicted HD phosphohydrolase